MRGSAGGRWGGDHLRRPQGDLRPHHRAGGGLCQEEGRGQRGMTQQIRPKPCKSGSQVHITCRVRAHPAAHVVWKRLNNIYSNLNISRNISRKNFKLYVVWKRDGRRVTGTSSGVVTSSDGEVQDYFIFSILNPTKFIFSIWPSLYFQFSILFHEYFQS